MATDAIPALTVFAHPYCYLCDDMIEGLRRRQVTHPFAFAVVDVDDDPLLEARAGPNSRMSTPTVPFVCGRFCVRSASGQSPTHP
ncbi:MAG: glutaredoxin family protein [Betaproteobacteria bacterium]|nr:glutaredoxin family protein [Betaproteobacteria bacterium]